MRLALSRIEALERHPMSHVCGECGQVRRYPGEPVPPGRLTVEESEAHLRVIVGGELFAAWPRCRRCGRLDPRFAKAIPTGVALDADDIRQIVQDFRAMHQVAA